MTLAERWHAHWFAPSAPTDLGLGRVVFFAVLAAIYLPSDFRGWAEVSPELWDPTWSFALLGLPVLGAPAFDVLQTVWKLALLCACLGLATRLSILVVLVLGFYLLGLPHCFGKVHHYDAMLMFVFTILALARSGDAWALDRLLARRGATAAAAAAGEYTWPIRAIRLVMALVFFGAGVSKLRTSGWSWIASDGMAIFLVQHQYHYGNAIPLTTFGLVLAQHAWLCRLLAAGTVVGETGYPLALVSRRAATVFVPAMLAMQIGIRVLLGPTFVAMMACNAFWVPWTRVLRAAQPRRVASAVPPAAA